MAESSREEIAKLEALYANNPEGRVFTHLAEAYRKAGELDRARTILEDGLAKHPAYASAHVVLGRVLTDQQRPDDAAQEFRRVLELDPHNHVALRCLGDIARSSGRRDEALQYFQDLRHLDPNNEEVSGIIDELSAAPAVASMQEVQPEAEPEGAASEPFEPEPFEPEHFEAQQYEPEAAPQEPLIAESEFAPPTADEGTEDLGQDLEFDWMPSPEEAPEGGLPGDLAELAGMSAPTEPAAGLPGFENPQEVAGLGDMDLSIGEPAAEQPSEPEPEPLVVEGFGAEPAPVPAAPEAEETGEVLTETIAELYRAQGLHDRAADVYRALIAQRPDEQALKDKLAEVEALANAPAAPAAAEPETPAPTAAAPEPEPWTAEPWESAPASAPEPMAPSAPPFEPTAPEAFESEPAAAEPVAAESASEPVVAAPQGRGVEAEAWIAGASGTAESAPTPYAWAEQGQAAEDVSGPPITDYFQRLLSWRPRTAPPAGRAVEEPASLQEPAIEPQVPEEMEWEAPPAEAPTAPVAMDVEAEPEPMLVLEEQVAEAHDFFAAPEQPAPPAPEQAPPAVSEPVPTAESFDAWLQQEPAPASRPGDSGDVFDEWFGASEPAESAPAQPEAAPTEAEQGSAEDDDDLEMFRSWLQSLKK